MLDAWSGQNLGMSARSPSIVISETASFYEDTTAFSLNTAVGGEVFLTQRRRDAKNAEKNENL